MTPTVCLFCKIAAGEIPATQAYEDDKIVAFHDLNPQAPVHLLVIPKEHIASTAAIDVSHAALLGHLWTTIPRLARELGTSDSGFRVVVNSGASAGQSVLHLHFHLLGGRAMGWPPG